MHVGGMPAESPSRPASETKAPGFFPEAVEAFIESTDPHEMSERLGSFVPGVRIDAEPGCRFRARCRAWRFASTTYLNYATDSGLVFFGAGRDYVVVSVPLCGSLRVTTAGRKLDVAPGEVHLMAPYVAGEFRPLAGTKVLGLIVDAGRVETQLQALDVSWDDPLVPTSTASGFRLAKYLDWVGAELRSAATPLTLPSIAREVADTLALLLTETACLPEDTSGTASGALAARAEERLAAHLDRPLSLSGLARELNVSVRTLSRAFHERREMGPIAFHRRRRLEAAHRDLFFAEPGETDVTRVALHRGFAHLGRFARDYKQAFGELPSETLRR